MARVVNSNGSIHKLMYQFEQKAREVNCGRYPYETLNNWFYRIEVQINPVIYEKIRYGKKSASKTEVESLKDNLKIIVDHWDASD